MNATKELHDLGQSLWLDNITRDLLNNGTLKRYIAELSVTGLTSNPTIFNLAFKNSTTYDGPISEKGQGRPDRRRFVLRPGAGGSDPGSRTNSGRSSTGPTVSTAGSRWKYRHLLAHDTASTIAAAKTLHKKAGRPNLFIKIPGTKEGLPAIEEAIFAGVPVQRHAPLLRRPVSCRGRRLYARDRAADRGGSQPGGRVGRVRLRQPLGRRGCQQGAGGTGQPSPASQWASASIRAYHDLLGSARWQRAHNEGAHGQRLLWASTGTKDPKASDILYVKALSRALHRRYDAGKHPHRLWRSW